MGRSRAVSQAAVDNHNQIRGKRKRTASGAEVAENSGIAQKPVAQEISEPKGAFYHCNYCNKDISGKIRIKCVVCPDFDLCIECFSVGAELTPHKCNHPYRAMDMSHVMGKSREELLALAKGSDEIKKEVPMLVEITLKEVSPLSAGIKCEESKKNPTSKSSSHSTADVAKGLVPGAVKKASNKKQIKDGTKVGKVEETQVDRSIGEKKLRSLVEEGPSMTELSGYNFKRQEFEIEYDNDAEQILAD